MRRGTTLALKSFLHMKIHFIGIGGIGISALAQYYLAKGHGVSGSDLNSSETTNFLKEKGAKLLIGVHKTENIPENTDLVIYSPAVQKENTELKQALVLQATGYKIICIRQEFKNLLSFFQVSDSRAAHSCSVCFLFTSHSKRKS